MSNTHTYSEDQITAYFERIKVPDGERIYSVQSLSPEEQLRYLAKLQKYHLAEVPFENLTLHYSFHRQVSIDPDDLFKKVVGDNNGRGGYCMENNYVLGTLLRSLGFQIYSAGARVFDDGNWSGWSHMVNLVTIGGRKYHVDVGFGANGPVVPMELEKSRVQPHIAPATARLRWDNIPRNTDPDQRLWIYEVRFDDKSEFQIMYCFTELEFLPSDYAMANYYMSTSPRTFFTRTVVAEKKILTEDGEVIGNLIMGNANLKWRIRGEKSKEINFEEEADRLKALEEHFGIVFGRTERESIQGLPSELNKNAR